MSTSLNSPFSVLMHRLEVASDKLDLVVAHYPDPSQLGAGDLGAIAITRDVAAELSVLYGDFSDGLSDAGLVQHGPWVDRFPEDLPESPEEETESETEPADSDNTGPRIHAYLASVRPLHGVAGISDRPEFQRGRALVERMAVTAPGTDAPTLKLSAAQCADVLYFISHVEPLEPQTWWQDPKYGPSHFVGYTFVLETLQGALRQFAKAIAAAKGAQS
jgi:hypothetical protein